MWYHIGQIIFAKISFHGLSIHTYDKAQPPATIISVKDRSMMCQIPLVSPCLYPMEGAEPNPYKATTWVEEKPILKTMLVNEDIF